MTAMSGAFLYIELENGLLPVHRQNQKDRNEDQFPAGSERSLKRRGFRQTEVKSRLHETAYLNPELTIYV